MAEEYTCTLSEASIKKAKKELNEDPKDRMGAVETFRKWIQDQKYINCPTDTRFLLPFLRARKFSQLEARKQLQKFLARRAKVGHFFQNFDTGDPNLLKVFNMGLVLLLPGRDKEGRKVFFLRPGKIDTSFTTSSKADCFRAMAALLDAIYFMDEDTQVNGTVTVVDFSGYGMKHQTNISLQDRKDFIGTWQGTYPARIKQVHLYNLGAMGDFILSLIKVIMSDKVKTRMKQHGDNLESLYSYVPMEMLPEEYLPDDYDGPTAGSEAQIIEGMKQMLSDPKVRDRIRYISSDKNTIDEKMIPGDVPQESFRKLNID